ncbi:MAG: protein sorting system archaetidylserine synthase [Halobacteriaceae archaeon]
MRPRGVGRLGLADLVTVANAVLGFLAVGVLLVDGGAGLAARLVLVASIADGLDGLVARRRGGSEVGEYLDSLADVASFAVAPAALVVAAAAGAGVVPGPTPRGIAVAVFPAVFVAVAVLRLGLFTAFDAGEHHTDGVQSTLAATILAAAVLSGARPPLLLAATGAFCYLMLAPVTYPDLLDRDALVMGAVQALAVAFPAALDRFFPVVLLVWALAYLALAPRYYWR